MGESGGSREPRPSAGSPVDPTAPGFPRGSTAACPIPPMASADDFGPGDGNGDRKVSHKNLINLSVPAFGTPEREPPLLNVVKRAVRILMLQCASGSLDMEDIPITYWEGFKKRSAELIFGTESDVLLKNMVATVQCLSDCSSLMFGAQFLAMHYQKRIIYVPELAWVNFTSFFRLAGLSVETYRYEHPQRLELDFEGLLEDITSATRGTIVFFHVCGHTPEGLHPTLDQWKQIRDVVRLKGLLPFFYTAYQGFASGSLDEDAKSVRMFVELGDQCIVAQNYAENMGLYDEPVGALIIVCRNAKFARWVESEFEALSIPVYTDIHCATIVNTILTDSEMFKEWTTQLKDLTVCIRSMRQMLFEALQQKGTPGDWSQIIKQNGLFTFTGLSARQIAYMTEEHGITIDGRINMARLNAVIIPPLVEAIHGAVTMRNSDDADI